MYAPGHIAASLLVARRSELNPRLLVGAALFPDVVDKTCRYVLGVVPSGRLPTHTLLALALSTGGIYRLGRRRGQAKQWALAWLVGYALHLLLDFAAPVPLLWPFASYDLGSYDWTYVFWHPRSPVEIASLAGEIALVAMALYGELQWPRRLRSSTSPRY